MQKLCTLFIICLLLMQGSIGYAEKRTAYEQARIAYLCALAGMAVYDTSMNQAVREEMRHFGWEFTNHKNANNRADTTFYTVLQESYAGVEKNTLVVIPGTEKLKDVEVDLRFGKVLFGGTNPAEFREYADREKIASTEPMVHQGFNDYTMTAFFSSEAGKPMGAEHLRQFMDEPDEHLYLTGHSLGGAVATLLAARLIAAGADPDKISVFSFGAPTVGNTAFAEEYGYRMDLSRYTMSGDMVKNALQMLKADYVHFGTEYKWQKNENSHKFNHSMAGYLDAGIRSYYDEFLGKELTLQQLAAYKPEPLASDDEVSKKPAKWFDSGEQNRVYIAPVYMELPDNIKNDAAYMQVVAADFLLGQFQHIAVGTENASASAADTLFAACKAADKKGCDTVALLMITAEADKSVPDVYRMAVNTALYDTQGTPLVNSMASTTTKEITPIEAVMYDMARVTADIRQAQENNLLPR